MARAEIKGTASSWLSRIDSAVKRENRWRERAKKVIRRYRDERGRNESESKINILWANTEVLKASVFNRMPKADVRRRFPDAAKQNSATRFAAEILERAIDYVVDVERANEAVSAAIDDQLLPGRGVCWWSYEPEIEEAVSDDAAGEGGGDSAVGAASEYDGAGAGRGEEQSYGVESGEEISAEGQARLVSQTLCLDYVYWEDYCQGVARQDREVPWKARRHVDHLSEFKVKFPKAKPAPLSGYTMKDADDQAPEGDDSEYIERWEIWDKIDRRRIFVARGYPDILQEDDDPYHLSGFYPTAKPLYSVTTTDKAEPIPEFAQYQDQAIELDRVSTRITKLLEQLKWRGIYDASVEGENVLANLPNADDGEFLPYRNWMMLKEKGGIENAIGFWPIDVLVAALKELYVQRNTLVQAIYEITGISDIIRGSTDPNETKGAQVLKARFGSMRMQKRQRLVQEFIRDTYAIGAEIIAEHFSQETLAEITQVELPTRMELAASATIGAGLPAMPAGLHPPAAAPQPAVPAPPMTGQQMAPPNVPPGPMPQQGTGQPTTQQKQRPTWEDVIDILRSDKTRGYRIDIETDQSDMEAAAEEKQARIEFVTALGAMMDKAYMAAMSAPKMLPLVKESMLFGLRTYKVGRPLEQAVEDAFDELQANPPQAPMQPQQGGTSPVEAQARMMESQAKIKEIEARIQLEQQKLATETAGKQAELQAKIAADQAQLDLERQKLAAEMHAKQGDLSLKVAAHNKSIVDDATAQATPAADGATPQPAGNGIVTLLAQMQQTMAILASGQQQLAAALTAPKRIVRDATGRAEGVATVMPQTMQ